MIQITDDTQEGKMKSVKKTLSVIGNVILWLFVIFAVFVTVLVFSSQSNKDGISNIFGKSLINIESDSMKPTTQRCSPEMLLHIMST